MMMIGMGERTQTKRSNDLIERPANLLNDKRHLSRQAGSSILAGLDRDIALRRGAQGFDVVGCGDDEAVDGRDQGSEFCGSEGFFELGGSGTKGGGGGVFGGGKVEMVSLCYVVRWME